MNASIREDAIDKERADELLAAIGVVAIADVGVLQRLLARVRQLGWPWPPHREPRARGITH